MSNPGDDFFLSKSVLKQFTGHTSWDRQQRYSFRSARFWTNIPVFPSISRQQYGLNVVDHQRRTSPAIFWTRNHTQYFLLVCEFIIRPELTACNESDVLLSYSIHANNQMYFICTISRWLLELQPVCCQRSDVTQLRVPCDGPESHRWNHNTLLLTHRSCLILLIFHCTALYTSICHII